jgi:hypothetical protein
METAGHSAIVRFFVLAFTILRVGAQSVQPTSAMYAWPGELVAADADGRTITVKPWVAGQQAVTEPSGIQGG